MVPRAWAKTEPALNNIHEKSTVVFNNSTLHVWDPDSVKLLDPGFCASRYYERHLFVNTFLTLVKVLVRNANNSEGLVVDELDKSSKSMINAFVWIQGPVAGQPNKRKP